MDPKAPNQADRPKTQMVYTQRPLDPAAPHITEAIQKRHEESCQRYPQLHLSDGEFVISDVRRHPIGLLGIWSFVIILGLVILIVLPVYVFNQSSIANLLYLNEDNLPSGWIIAVPLLIVLALLILGGLIATIVYKDNRFYLTNESVIQHIRTSLFARNIQTISLTNIEDASYNQRGILPTLFNYGSLRLSTQGDETTYRFHYVANPKDQLMKLNDAVEAFKNGRPVDFDDQ